MKRFETARWQRLIASVEMDRPFSSHRQNAVSASGFGLLGMASGECQ